jgi:hypothetical protein
MLLAASLAGRLQPDAFQYGKIAAVFEMTVDKLQKKVDQAVRATHRAATAVSKKSADDVVATVGLVGLMGLIAFAVAALLSDKG